MRTLICVAALAVSSLAPNALAEDQWVATWAASPQGARFVFPLPARAAPISARDAEVVHVSKKSASRRSDR